MISFRLSRPGIRLFEPNRILFILWLFLLIFPKGGFKIVGVPITWGYLILGTISIFLPLIRPTHSINTSRLLSLLSLVPFQIVSLAHIMINGSGSTGMTISFLLNFFFLPSLFFLLLSQNIDSMNLDRFFTLFKKGVFYISIFGVFLFIYKIATGKLIEIPFLTMNWADLGEVADKHNNRGFVTKLISTYNNGNLYGICVLILLPLYCYLEAASWRRAIVKLSLLLTLSRTIWIGLLFHEICYSYFVENRAMKSLLNAGIILSFLLFLSLFFDFPLLSFIFDSSLGGRREAFSVFQDPSLFSTIPFCGICEVVYAGICDAFGVIGLLTFLIGMGGPLMIHLLRGSLCNIQTSICLGIVNYLLISGSDGGILFIPVMAFFWFFCSLLSRPQMSQRVY